MIRLRNVLLAVTLELGFALSCSAQSVAAGAPRDAREAQLLLDQAEEAYRGNDLKGAFERLGQVIDADPAHAFAWLRIGNLWQRMGDPVRAIDAYRTAAGLDGGARAAQPDPVSRQKALLNLAGLTQSMLRDALREMDADARAPELVEARQALEAGLRELGGCPPATQAAAPAPIVPVTADPASSARRTPKPRPAPGRATNVVSTPRVAGASGG